MPRTVRKILLQAVAAAIAVIAIGLAFAAYAKFAPNNILSLFLLGGLVFFAVYVFRLSKQIVLVAEPVALSEDTRAPVLYLRMFKDDEFSQRGGLAFQESLTELFVSEEERLVSVLNDFGPVVALGIPGEKLPGLGAIREYVAHDVWQQHVHDYMKKAVLVVLRLTPHATENLLWEFKEAVREVAPERLILLVPQPHSYEAFRQLASQAEPSNPLPSYPNSALRKLTLGEKVAGSTVGAIFDAYKVESINAPIKDRKFMARWVPDTWFVTALIYFKPDGTPCFEAFGIPKGRRFNIATAFRYAMKPVFRQHGLRWRDAPRDLGGLVKRIFWWSLWSVVFIILAIGMIVDYYQRHY
jgi:hypothetical protein